MNTSSILRITIACLVILSGCTTSRQTVAERVTPDKVAASGLWNDSDSEIAAGDIATGLIQGRWIQSFHHKEGKVPAVVIGAFSNSIHEIFSSETFIHDLEQALVQEKSLKVILAAGYRQTLRRDNEGQQHFTSPEILTHWGKTLNADFLVRGNISSSEEVSEGETWAIYTINIEVYDLTKEVVVWSVDKKIRKHQGLPKGT